MKIQSRIRTRERGAVLILTLAFAASLSALALSSFSTIEANFAISRQEADALRAELAAQSGLEYGRFRLALDEDWTGITGSGVEIAPGTMFTCVPTVAIGGSLGSLDLEVTGESGDGYRELQARLSPSGGNFEGDIALAMLGGDDYINGTDIYGDVLITDDLNRVWDWVYDGDGVGSYELGGPDPIEGSELLCSWVNGTIYKFTSTDYAGWPTDEVELDSAHQMPEWDLDVYLPENGASSADYEIFYNKTKFQCVTYWKPVIVINDPGKNLYVKNCRFYGGLVMWCPKDYDLRSGKRQTLKVKDSVIGSSCHPDNIGIIAPACEFQQISGAWSVANGFSMFHDIKNMRCFHHTGMAYVVNRVKRICSSEFFYDEYVHENLPPGIQLETQNSGYTYARLGENLD